MKKIKVTRGMRGYINHIKKKEYIWALFLWALVLIIYLSSKLDSISDYILVLAILNCLPAAKTTVAIIVKHPYRSIDKELAVQIEAGGSHVLVLYDMILSNKDTFMNVDSIAIYGNTVCGFISNSKTDRMLTESYVRTILERTGYEKLTIKFFEEFKPYLTRVEGLDSIAKIENKEDVEKELAMGQLILSHCM